MKRALCTAESSAAIHQLDEILDMNYAGWATEQRILSEDELAEMVAEIQPEILITSYDPITRKVMEKSPALGLIVCTRANPVNVDVEYARARGIAVSYSPGRNSDCTAEYTVALMLSVMRRIPFSYHDLKQGKHSAKKSAAREVREGLRRDVTWGLGKDTPYIEYKGYQMRGRRLGVVGYGSIGRKVADICRAFGMEIFVFDPFLKQDQVSDAKLCPTLLDLAAKVDVLTIHAKDSVETWHLINKEVLAVMKPTAFLINTSRGILLDETALIEALKEKRIAGAALDVFDSEPIREDHPFLLECENIVLTPHLAGATYDAIENHTQQLLADVQRYLRGEGLKHNYLA